MAEVVTDENGNIVDLKTIITMTTTIATEGSLGNLLYFIRHHQYQFTAKSLRMIDIDYQKEFGNVMMYHYEVVIDNETFYIPAAAAAIENKLRPWWQQDFHGWAEHKADQPRDFIGAYKEVTGIDLKKRASQEEHNGYEIMENWKKEQEKDQGKQYGPGFEEDPEDLRREPI